LPPLPVLPPLGVPPTPLPPAPVLTRHTTLAHLPQSWQATTPVEALGRLDQVQVALGAPATARVLLAFRADLQRRALRDCLAEVARLGGAAKWEQAGRLAGEHTALVPGPARPVLERVARLARRDLALRRLRTALEAGRAWPQVAVEDLPESLRPVARGLRALAEVRAVAEGSLRTPPDAAQLRRACAEMGEALGDPDLVARVRQDLAVRAFLAGHPGPARELLPRTGSPAHAAAALRDLTVLLAGKGKVSSTPAARAARRGPPPGVKPLLPEADRRGWRVGVRESARADLPPLDEAGQLLRAGGRRPGGGKKGQDGRSNGTGAQGPPNVSFPAQVQAALARQQDDAQQALAAVRQLEGRERDEEGEDECLLESLARRLGRPLTPAERVVALQLRRQGTPAKAIAGQLRRDALASLSVEVVEWGGRTLIAREVPGVVLVPLPLPPPPVVVLPLPAPARTATQVREAAKVVTALARPGLAGAVELALTLGAVSGRAGR
jgi:hypothetical protein